MPAGTSPFYLLTVAAQKDLPPVSPAAISEGICRANDVIYTPGLRSTSQAAAAHPQDTMPVSGIFTGQGASSSLDYDLRIEVSE